MCIANERVCRLGRNKRNPGIIHVGMIAYYYAAEGMSEKFQESAQQTANMAMQYMDVSCTYIQSEGLKYSIQDFRLNEQENFPCLLFLYCPIIKESIS